MNIKEIRSKAFKQIRTCPFWEVSAQLRNDPTANGLTQKSFPKGILTAQVQRLHLTHEGHHKPAPTGGHSPVQWE